MTQPGLAIREPRSDDQPLWDIVFFHGIVRFSRVENSITYVFSIRLNIPTPPRLHASNYCVIN
jgi:hypothetical protein